MEACVSPSYLSYLCRTDGLVATFDLNGITDFVDICRKAFEDHVKLTIAGGTLILYSMYHRNELSSSIR